MCNHDSAVQKYEVVNPPTSCYPFTVRFYYCENCDKTFTTTKQRRKNRKNYHQASRKYDMNNQTHGIYY